MLKSILLLTAFTFCSILVSSQPLAAAPWVSVEILKVDEGVWDSHHKKPCYKITVGVKAGEVNRATVKLSSKIETGGKKYSPSSTQNVGTSGMVEFKVPEDWLGSPSTGEEIIFQADAIGYYTVIEYRTVQYVEYVPAVGGHY